MIGRQKTYCVQLTEKEKELLQQQAIARKTEQSKVKRLKIILTAVNIPIGRMLKLIICPSQIRMKLSQTA